MQQPKDTNLNYNLLKSIVSSGKTTFQMQHSSESFLLPEKPTRPYIEPTLKKIEYDHEKPTVVLVSAVGATGKTALTRSLSWQTGLPLLDLAKHKPVGDNTLTGLLTSAYKIEDLSRVFQSIKTGSFGVLIDGIDEGRAKTTDKAFEAFLDDIVRLCGAPSNTSFVLLGRTQVLDECWLYLTEKGIATNLLSIAPFSFDDARKYIDTFTHGLDGQFRDQYSEARDFVLNSLSKAFVGKSDSDGADFLSFIGYPPVLEAIVTLLIKERNYHRLTEQLKGAEGSDMEVSLLRRIAFYILEREKIEKVVPIILNPLLAELPSERQAAIEEKTFSIDEQCMRLIAFSLKRQLTLQSISEKVINEKYEAQLATFLPEHPFLSGHNFRNAVFESLSLAVLLSSNHPACEELVLRYVSSHKYNYHLIYLLENLVSDGFVPSRYLSIIVGSALEFRSPTSTVEFTIEGGDNSQPLAKANNQSVVDIDIEIIFNNERSKSFLFHSNLQDVESIQVGSRLASAYISIPCDLVIGGEPEADFTAPVEVSARTITITSTNLVLRHPHTASKEDSVIVLEASKLISSLEHITTNGLGLVLALEDNSGVAYPAINHVTPKVALPNDPLLHEKYFRLKRILMEFRSHSRGTMAKYKQKIEHDRVLRNDTGRKILKRLLSDGVLQLKEKFYFLIPDAVDKFLGVSWLDLRRGQTDPKLIQYLQSIN